jgi:hypothetical protein
MIAEAIHEEAIDGLFPNIAYVHAECRASLWGK